MPKGSICHAKFQNDGSNLKTSKVTKYSFSCKYPTQVPQETEQLPKAYHDNLYLTKIENITMKITKSFTLFHIWHSKLFHWSLPFSACYELQKCELGDLFRGLIPKVEFKNPSSANTMMKWKTGKRILQVFIFVYSIFSFEMDFLWNQFGTNRHDRCSSNHPPI